MLISPNFTAEKVKAPCRVENKIDVFADWMNGWVFQHAWALCDSKYTRRSDAGFAVLTLCATYFEPIESYISGKASQGRSKKFFRRGFLRVFHRLPETLSRNGFKSPKLAEEIADEMYTQLRCGLFHEGGVKHKLLIRSDSAALGFMLEVTSGQVGSIVVDPLRFLAEIQSHLNGYVVALRNPVNTTVRENFESFFDARLDGAGGTVMPPIIVSP